MLMIKAFCNRWTLGLDLGPGHKLFCVFWAASSSISRSKLQAQGPAIPKYWWWKQNCIPRLTIIVRKGPYHFSSYHIKVILCSMCHYWNANASILLLWIDHCARLWNLYFMELLWLKKGPKKAIYMFYSSLDWLKATTGVCEAHLHQAYKPCVI